MLASFVLLTFLAAPPGDAEVAALIARLGDDAFEVREEAQRRLVALGRPALPRLFAAIQAGDIEVRMRAARAGAAIDPAFPRRVALLRRRPELLAEVRKARGFDAGGWGLDVPNPFNHVSAAGVERLAAEGVVVNELRKMRAVLIDGDHGGTLGKTFVNRDPNTVLILGDRFVSSEPIWSAGPVLVVGPAQVRGRVTAAGPAWFVERGSLGEKTRAAPLLAGPEVVPGHTPWSRGERAEAVVGDFGWRRPPGGLDAPLWKPGAKRPPLSVADAAAKRAALLREVRDAKGVDTKGRCEKTANPFRGLSPAGKARLAARGVDAERLGRLAAVRLTGDYFGDASRDFVNRDPDTVLVVGPDFRTHGRVFSAGPVAAVGDAHFMDAVTGADVVWFADRSSPGESARGLPVVITTTAHSQMSHHWEDTWHGDYGWPARAGRK